MQISKLKSNTANLFRETKKAASTAVDKAKQQCLKIKKNHPKAYNTTFKVAKYILIATAATLMNPIASFIGFTTALVGFIHPNEISQFSDKIHSAWKNQSTVNKIAIGTGILAIGILTKGAVTSFTLAAYCTFKLQQEIIF